MRSLVLAFVVLSAACSSADFDVTAADPDSGSSHVEDTSSSMPDVAAPPPPDGASPDAATADACSDIPPTPPCAVANNGYDYQIDSPRSAAVGQLYKGREIAIHVKMPRAGRLGKLILRMNAVASGITSGVAGQITVTAYRRGCMPIPIGKSILPIQSGEDWPFYFDPMRNAASTLLPVMPAGTDIDFVVTTDSTAYKFNLVGAAPVTPNPHGLYWGHRDGGSGGWSWQTASMLSLAVWTYIC